MAGRLLNGLLMPVKSCKTSCTRQLQRQIQPASCVVCYRSAHSGGDSNHSENQSTGAQTYAMYASIFAVGGYFLWRETRDDSGVIKHAHCVSRREDDTFPSNWLPAYKSLVYGKSATGYYDLPKVQPGEDVYSIARTFFADTRDDLGRESLPNSEVYARVASSQIPRSVPYLIVGAGTSAMSAARAIRASDPRARVLLIGDERDPPYLRPPLSKQIWQRDTPRVARFLNPKGDYSAHSWFYYEPTSFFMTASDLTSAADGGIALLLDRAVASIDTQRQTVTLNSGELIAYEKLLLATGGRPRTLPAFENSDANVRKRISYYRTVQDFKVLRTILSSQDDINVGSSDSKGKGDAKKKTSRKQPAKTIAIIGGGFLGAELALALKTAKFGESETPVNVVCVFPEAGFLEAMLPSTLSHFVTQQILAPKADDASHVRVLTKQSVRACAYDARTDKLVLETDSGETVAVDHAVVCVGIAPNTGLAKSARLETDAQFGGFLVNAELQAGKNVWAAGDAACFYDPLLGRRRIEHHLAAEQTGRIAGCNMVGEHRQFVMQPSFWCDVGQNVAIEAVGVTDARRYRTVTVALKGDQNTAVDSSKSNSDDDLSKPAVVFYTDDSNKIVGVLLWNVRNDFFEDDELYAPQRLNLARKLLEERRVVHGDAGFIELAREFDLAGTIDEEFREIKHLVESDKQETESSDKKQDAAKRDKVMRKLEMLKAQSSKKDDASDPFAIASK